MSSINQSIKKNCTHLSIHLHFAPHAIRYISSHNRKLEKSLFLFISRYCSNNWLFFIHDSWEHLSHILIIRTAFIFIKFDFVFFLQSIVTRTVCLCSIYNLFSCFYCPCYTLFLTNFHWWKFLKFFYFCQFVKMFVFVISKFYTEKCLHFLVCDLRSRS